MAGTTELYRPGKKMCNNYFTKNSAQIARLGQATTCYCNPGKDFIMM
jgi:hypothetical protein